MLLLLLKGEKEKIAELYERYADAIAKHQKDISWLAKNETLQDSLDSYQAKVKAKKRNAAAPYELALKAERPYQPGDQVSYYVTGNKAKVKISENSRLTSDWDEKNPDENVEHYKAKLKELYEKFRPWIDGSEQGIQEPELRIQESD
jgi:DNA polymerase I